MGDYRNDARRQLERAQSELSSGDDERIKYAALELREAMESLTYDRALAYKDEFPPQEYETWQPRKVMAVLLDIDPNADKDSSLAVGLEPSPGEAPAVMHSLGNEKVLNLKALKDHYDALGSFLHVQSLKQRRSGVRLDYAAMRRRCDTVAAYLDEVLRSPVWNATFGNFATTECVKCDKPVRKRIAGDPEEVRAKCHECGAGYIITPAGTNKYRWTPDEVELACANPDCGTKIFAFRSEIELNAAWTCQDCGGQNALRLCVRHEPKEGSAAAGSPNEPSEMPEGPPQSP